MNTKKMFSLGGREVPGEEIEFESEKETFNLYLLHDGTRLKYKSVVSSVIRLEAYQPNGEPIYLVNATNILVADVPNAIKRKRR